MPTDNAATPNLGVAPPRSIAPVQNKSTRNVRPSIVNARLPSRLPSLPETADPEASLQFDYDQALLAIFPDTAAGIAEASAASLVYDAHMAPRPELEGIGPWSDVDRSLWALLTADPHSTIVDTETITTEATGAATRLALLGLSTAQPLPRIVHESLFKELQLTHTELTERWGSQSHTPIVQDALRADSDGAPATQPEAVRLGGPWPPSMLKELGNHATNLSWRKISIDDLPRNRRLHKLVWVFKLKRDGTAKARLCVQGCTLESGVDYDQTFSQALRHGSARALFGFAARKGCYVRSIDYVAAYLQGSFTEGEVVYCRMAPGFEEHDEKGRPYILCIEKPIYGIPQAGRRLQRQIFPWLKSQGLTQLDDSDGCVWVHKGLTDETFVLGVYVDNLQVVHSVEVNNLGVPSNPDSFYAKFLAQLNKDWDVIDEGPMDDLLAIQMRVNNDNSFTLHQESYIRRLLARFLPKGAPPHVQKNSLPYSKDFLDHINAALGDPENTSKSPKYPHLVKPFQERTGAVMYLSVGTRADISYPTHQLARVMARPTPQLMLEFDHLFAYLARHPGVGLTFSHGSGIKFEGYSDASWETRWSTSGWVIKYQGAAVAWGSCKQDCIALSSCEAEIIALSEAAKDMVYYRKLFRGLDPDSISGPSDLHTDNQGAQDLAYNPEHHNKTKHVERRHFYVRDMVKKFELTVPYVRTHANLADFLTKPFKSAPHFFELRREIMNEPRPPR